MSRLIYDLRSLIAEWLLNLAVSFTPPNSAEEGAMCQAAQLYLKLIGPELSARKQRL